MSQVRSQLVAEVLRYCGDPPDLPLKDGGLQQDIVFQILVESENEMLRDLDLSTNNRRVSKTEFSLTNQVEFPLTVDGNPSYAMLQVDNVSEYWLPVEIVNHASLLQAGLDGRLAIAFHDTPATAEISWVPAGVQTLRIWYDRAGDDAPQLAASTELGNFYDSYLKLRTAAQCRELMGLPVGSILTARLMSSERQWKRYVDMSRQQGRGYKRPVFLPGRYRRLYPFVDRTRFFIP